MSTASVRIIISKIKILFLRLQTSATNSIKIAVLGKGVVGKSSLTYRFINYNAPQEHDPTIEDRYKSNLNIDGTDYEVEILDTAGEEDYQNMMDMWISFGEGFLLVFAINEKESFELLKAKHERVIKGKHGVKCPILLVGNKHDLAEERQVTQDEANQLAQQWGIEYIETSAKTNFNCKEAFERLAHKIVQSKNPGARPGPCPCCNVM